MATVTHCPRYDTVVVGLGGMGSSAAYHLARRGARVLALERFEPANAMGSSHGESRIIRQAYFEEPSYGPLLARAYELWEELSRISGKPTIKFCGGLTIGTPSSQAIRGSISSAQSSGLHYELLDADEIRRRFNTLTPSDNYVGFHEPSAGLVHPEDTIRLHLKLASSYGADLRFGIRVSRWENSSDGSIIVHADNSRFIADNAIIAPGAWAPSLLADLGILLTVERQVQYWFDPSGDKIHWLSNRHPVWIWEDEASASCALGFPLLSRTGAKVVFEGNGTPVKDVDKLQRTVTPGEVRAVVRQLESMAPSLALGDVAGTAVCTYTLTSDRNFVVGYHPSYRNLIIACGFSGHGFKFVPIIGEILADLALQGSTAYPISLLDPKRPGLARYQCHREQRKTSHER